MEMLFIYEGIIGAVMYLIARVIQERYFMPELALSAIRNECHPEVNLRQKIIEDTMNALERGFNGLPENLLNDNSPD